MPKSEPRAGIRASTRKIKSHSTTSDPQSIQRLEPSMCSLQQPLRSRRRPSTLAQVPGSSSRDPPSAPSLENHEACLATVKILEQEIKALERDKETLLEHLQDIKSKKQKLSPASLPDNVDPAALRTALPATTAAPDMWTTQENRGGVFDNNHDIAPGPGDFTQFLQF
ncbi:uncharacterized protein BO88DRAFT_429999 [Aspergillus vadensis CBS 113365]|uniref:Uncharacterized protein n=1 Tax=Aspergillus vadensis (strain CBS 113365 / IMI 142717 / IBT 24658) TaxID=1448311 RepID=A0A319C5E6_ASPVC|nr:hypothetical protein BO88DRAFT_429999 [Aspergillus vadensis CBS 113365]PYH64002.1 hypothetical protein BO88DRAFT_429999 [Aspergillus vadensis CBS 113365]